MTALQPFACQNALTLTDDEIDALQVDREDELSTTVLSLGTNYENILLYGSRGVGKTFLVKLLARKLQEHYPDLLPVYVQVAGLPMYNPGDLVAAFSRAVLLQICVSVWKSVLHREYTALRDHVSASDATINLTNRAERTVQRIFSMLMTSQRLATTELANNIGFSAGVTGEKSDKYSVQKLASDTLPFEFAEFVDELITEVLTKNGKTRIVALCDDANQLPIFSQEEILLRYFELFRAKKVQFLFVAAWQEWQRERRIPLCFETVLELKGFTDFAVFAEFMGKAAQGAISFNDDALHYVHDFTKGEAVPALHIGYACRVAIREGGNQSVDLALARRCAETYRMKTEYAKKQVKKSKC